MDFIRNSSLEENVRRILQQPRHTRHPGPDVLYKEPFNPSPELVDFRQILHRTLELFGQRDAFLIKEPRAFGETTSFDKRGLPKRLADYRAVSHQRYLSDVRAMASIFYGLPLDLELSANSDELLAAVERAAQPEYKPENLSHATAIIGETRYEWYVSYFALGQGQTTIVPLDRELPVDELLNCLQRAKCDTLCVAGDLVDKILERRAELPLLRRIICFDELREGCLDFWELLELGHKIYSQNPYVDSLPLDPEALSVLLFTSGTTARSKAVMLSQKSIIYELDASLKIHKMSEQDRFLSVLPLHHTYESSCGFILPIYIGASVAVSEGLRYIAQNIKEAQPTIMLVVPLMLETFYKKLMKNIRSSAAKTQGFKLALQFSRLSQMVGVDPSQKLFKKVHDAFPGLDGFIVGGAAVDAKLMADWRALGFKCVQGYGMTETSPIVSLNPDYAPKDKSAGLPIPGTEFRIINADENGIGEVIVRGPGLMIGYYDDPEKTGEVIDDEGFYHTGDLGYLDEDYYLILTGRKANLIVSKNGKNIFPEEIEFMLKQYPIVEEAIVRMGRDDRGEEQLIAEIYPSRAYMDEHEDLLNLDLDHPMVNDYCLQIIKEVNQKLVSYKHLRSVFIRTEPFPMTSSRKVKRNEL